MPSASRLNDTGSGHASWPPTTVMSASTNVITEGLGQARKTDPLIPHASPSPSPVHNRSISGSSTTVKTNGLGTARIGDAIDCGGMLVSGASKTNVGG